MGPRVLTRPAETRTIRDRAILALADERLTPREIVELAAADLRWAGRSALRVRAARTQAILVGDGLWALLEYLEAAGVAIGGAGRVFRVSHTTAWRVIREGRR